MKLFECQNCRQPQYFENSRCERCGLRLGFLWSQETLTALREDESLFRAFAEPSRQYRYCANAAHEVCNWLVESTEADVFCLACRHNRTIPDLSQPENLGHWRRIEVAKHRLFYTLHRLGLPLATRTQDADGLAFDFLADTETGEGPVLTGHSSGLITINLAEADDAERERRRGLMGEPYRTLLGHFRHEVAHFYWDRLVANSPHLDKFRVVFGDERADYGAALQQHYASGPPGDWAERFVTGYASAHPWEDFAETWAHYFHMVDTLETAHAFGLRVRPRETRSSELATSINFDAYLADIDQLIDAWLPLTFAMNSMNRSMGLQDLYPFMLPPAVIGKLTFIHDIIHAQRELAAHAANLRPSTPAAATTSV